jgi:hypothetical protein
MLAGVVGGMCGGEDSHRMDRGKKGVTNVTEVGFLNCDCEEHGFVVSGLGGDFVCAFGGSMWRGPEPEASMSTRFWDDGLDGDVCVRR